MFHSSLQNQVSLATVNCPISGGNSVCCGHGIIVLHPETVQTTHEDSEDRKMQQTLKLNS